MHCSRFSLALLLPFLVASATAAPAAPPASGLDNALQLGAEGLVLPLTPAPVPAAVKPLTNGERFKKGLPPAAPKKRAFRALAPRSSPVAPRIGKIRINKMSDGSLIGYAAPGTHLVGTVGAKGTGSTDSFGVSISAAESTTQAEISIVSTPKSTFSNFFLGGQANSGDLFATTNNFNFIAGVPHTAPGSTAQRLKSTYGSSGVESSIFTIGPNSALTATWINTNGANAPTFLCYFQGGDYLRLSSNTGATACPMAVTWTFV